jgi:hypothetical protein
VHDVDSVVGCVDRRVLSTDLAADLCEVEELWATLGDAELLIVEVLLDAVRVLRNWALLSREVVGSVADLAGEIEEEASFDLLLGCSLCGHCLCRLCRICRLCGLCDFGEYLVEVQWSSWRSRVDWVAL